MHSRFHFVVNFHSDLLGHLKCRDDVEANLGIHTRAFLDLGALVTAYEPNPYCRDVLNNRFWDEDRLRLSGSGICAGTDSRMETFHVCEAHCLSTFSKCEEHRPTNRKWKRTTQIYMIPLDWAIDQHRDNFGSLPDYVKIDVQGMDSEIAQRLMFLLRKPKNSSRRPKNTMRIRSNCGLG